MALKHLKPGTATKLAKLSSDEHKTTPPGRFSEVKLVSELESRGIGRPATFSSIVSLIQERGYVAKKGTQLYPTPLGFAVARLLAAKFPQFTAYDYTARMETELDDIAAGHNERVKFLGGFWKGDNGFAALLQELSKDIDFKEIEQYSTVDLHNGYSIRFSKFGTFLQHHEGKPDAKGYLPSVRIDDDSDVWDYREREACEAAFESAGSKSEPKELGTLTDGEYKGWSVWAREGKFGAYLQALHPKHVQANEQGKKPAASVPKPVNHKLPEHESLESVTLEAVEKLFSEVKLPRTLSPNFFTGIGKRGAWLGHKASAKSRRAVFVGLPSDLDPRTMSLEDAERVWKEKQAAKKR